MIAANKPDKRRTFPLTLSPCHLVTLSLLGLLACGCTDSRPAAKSPISLDPAVKVVHPQYRTVKRTVEQPGVIGAYERTALYAKVAGFVAKWNVDIGDRVKQGQTLVKLTAPEVVAQHEQMQAQVVLDRALVEQSNKQHLVAQRNVMAATEMVAQAKADVNRYEADVERWTSEVKRLTSLVAERVVDQQVLDETRRQLKSSQASLEASRAAVKTRDAQRLAAEATTEKTKVDISAAEAKVKVAEADERRLAALVDYLTIPAPYDGVVFARNVNLGDFVTPASGDPTQGVFSLGVSPSKATPLYVLNRIDPVLFIIGVPEAYSAYVAAGSTARIRVPAAWANHEFPAKVTRTSGAARTPPAARSRHRSSCGIPTGSSYPACTPMGRCSSSGPASWPCGCRPSRRSATKPIAISRSTARPSELRSRPASATTPGWRCWGSRSPRPARPKAPGRRSTAPRPSLSVTSRKSSTAYP